MKDIRKVRWELAKKLKRGKPFIFKPTMRCNLNCPYCSVNKAHGRAPVFDEYGYNYWLSKIKYTDNVRQVTISGGEPGLYKGLSDLVNELVDDKYIVLIFTNLTKIDEFLKIKKTWRVIFLASYHPVFALDKYLENYSFLFSRFYITAREVLKKGHESERRLDFSKIKYEYEFQDDEYVEIYAPDGRLFYSCHELDQAGR